MLTKTTKSNLSWDANICSATQNIPSLLRASKLYYHVLWPETDEEVHIFIF